MTDSSFYRRPLPEPLIPFASAEGRAVFRDALTAGTLEGFFALSEQFHTQADPAYCGLGSLVVTLNALGIDPGRLWKGPWRWFGEEMLDCCVSLDVVRERGLTLGEVACLAGCNGARAEVRAACDSDPLAFRDDVERAATSARGPFLIAAYDRTCLGQTGGGHFSPIGGYDAKRDLVLVLDVARFKYPPHWVPLTALHAAMSTIDPHSNRSRGWIVVTADDNPRPVFLRLGAPAQGWQPAIDELLRLRQAHGGDIEGLVRALAGSSGDVSTIIETVAGSAVGELASEHRERIEAVLCDVRRTRAYAAARAVAATRPEAVAVLALALTNEAAVEAEPPSLRALATEIVGIRRQLRQLCSAT